ncbi:MAG TPA: alpha/beta fold hydrolase [Labilithrix sp.]|nr:alpha/beta fold hydrolase [Labilithrix sp.]
MRAHVFGLFGAVALTACGSESGVPSMPSPSGEAVGAPSDVDTPSPPSSPAKPAPAAKLGAPYPIVLLHGMAGFESLELGPVETSYFSGVAEDLAEHGEDVYLTVAPPYETSEVRAGVVAKQLDEILARTGKAKVNLIGHSQGGLDARVLASAHGLAYGDRIASVTTVATPHRGTKIADLALGLIDYVPKKQLDDVVGAVLTLVQRTAYDLETDSNLRGQVGLLTEKYMAEVFNPKYVDARGVVYRSYAGRTNRQSGKGTCDDAAYPNEPRKVDRVTPALLPTAVYLEEVEGQVNDGLVPVESAKWGTFEQCVPADHMKEVGLLGEETSFDHRQFFRDIVARLRESGL